MGLVALGFEPGECASMLSNTVVEWVLRRPGRLSARRRLERHLPDRCAGAGRISAAPIRAPSYLFVEDDEQLDKALEVRARLPKLRKIVVFDMDGLRDFQRSAGDEPRRAARARPRLRRRASGRSGASASPLRKPADLAMLIYTSGTTGKPKGAMHLARRNLSHGARLYTDASAQDERRRAHVLPAALPRRRAHRRRVLRRSTPARGSTSSRTPRRCRRTCARSRRPCSPRCRAIWEKFYSAVTIARARGDARSQQLAYALAIGVGYQVAERVRAGQARAGAAARSRVLARARARARQRPQADRHAPRALAASPARRRSRPTWSAGTWRSACRWSRSGA